LAQPSVKKWKLWRLPKRWNASPFGPPIKVRREGLWAKHMALRRSVIGNIIGGTHQELREHIGNLMGT
jgi:hypothetical protein